MDARFDFLVQEANQARPLGSAYDKVAGCGTYILAEFRFGPLSETMRHRVRRWEVRTGRIAGDEASLDDISRADESNKGFTQLTYHLIKLSRHLIENAIL